MVDFINEVQEELRKDDYNRWLKRYGPYLVAAIVGVVGAVAALEWIKAKNEREARVLSVAYTDASALAVDDALAGEGAFADIAADTNSGYAGLALMRAAALATERGEAMEAVRYLDGAAEAFDKDRHVHLARLKAAYILADEELYADAQARLQGLTERGAPFEYLARELQGYAELAQGNTSAAAAEFRFLSTIPGAPPTLAERAQQSLSLIDASASIAAAEEQAAQVETETDTPSEISEETEQ